MNDEGFSRRSALASIKANGAPQEVPDFTRGLWEKERPGIDSEKH